MEWLATIIVGGLSCIGTIVGAYTANKKHTALIAYRLEQLEQKVQAHNNLVDRMYAVERRADVLAEKITVANHRIDDLEKGG